MIFMKQLFTFPADELLQEDTVYVTIVQELHATTLTNDKDRIQFENLVSKARKKVKDANLEEEDALLEQLDAVLTNQDSLIKFIGGLVIYVTPEGFYFYHLGIDVNDRVFVGNLPYILPLAENNQYTIDYNLLAITRDSMRVFEGHGDSIFELDFSEYEDAPIDSETVLGTDKDGGALNFGTYSGGASRQAGSNQFFHGHNEVSEEKDIDRERYFRAVDDFVYHHVSNDNGYPLILFSVEENQNVFNNISKNNYLVKTAITGSPAGLTDQQIQERAADTIHKLNDTERQELLDELNETPPENKIENIPDDLAATSVQGRIYKLYLVKDTELPGTITDEGLYDPESDKNDFVQLLIRNVISSSGEVYFFDEEDMPEDTPVAAKLRY